MPHPTTVSRPYPSPMPAGLTPADDFIDLASVTFHGDDGTRRRRRAERLAAARPDLANESFLAAVVLGDVAAVRKALTTEPGLATRPAGPREWVPLLWLAFGRVQATHGDAVAVARLLLDAGADSNSHVVFDDCCRFTAITGAIGEGESGPVATPPHRQARALVELLLDAGADPNDSQSLYNTHFLRDNAWLALFLSRGLGAQHAANWSEGNSTRILDYLLGQAVAQGYLDRVALLLAHGATPNGTNHYNKRTHLESAHRAGHTAIAALLHRQGAVPGPPASALDDGEAFLLAAEHGQLPRVRSLLDKGVPIDAMNAGGATALHLAAANGHRLVVDELLRRGASQEIRDRIYGGTPLGRVTWFSRAWPTPERDEVRGVLAECSMNVFDLVGLGPTDRLATLLAADPSRARSRHPLDGRSPLHVVAARDVPDSERLIDMLLDHGADLEARNDKGQTPLDLATEEEAVEVVEVLVRRGAQSTA